MLKRRYEVNLDRSILFTANLHISGDKSTTTKVENKHTESILSKKCQPIDKIKGNKTTD